MQEVSGPSDTDHARPAPGAKESSINLTSLFPPEPLVVVFNILYQGVMESLPFPIPYDEGLRRFKNHPLGDFMLVCRVWYDLIQTTPTYWTFVDIGALDNTALGKQAHAVRSFGTEGLRDLKRRLKKGGSLPICVPVTPEHILDFRTVLDILKEHGRRLETINIIKMPHLKTVTLRHISTEQLLQMFRLPLPSLKHLHIDEFHLDPPPPEPWVGGRVEIDAPQLYHLSSHFHILIPHNPSQLTSLSMSGVDMLTIQSTFAQGQVQLPKLLHLRIVDYVGPDPTFDLVFQRCPNLTRYANYVIGREMELDISLLTDPTILTRPGGINSIKWPNLEEVRILFDCATYAALTVLIHAVLTIKRIRTLRDPVASPLYGGDIEWERKFLSELREIADVVLWLDPWTSE
ncbi:hypothetical protein M407DRAFT_28916 [Tulasnella calospora MUT 4182]|uniref:F-box domain-containing protein n=1 Tax=Tulasnella calospora MUT 4182 TaxID=1051891 RepID=A0A0C3KJ34_9AGAM|nr:hypothetical protein M407DRAFT_28916 [Tulasnella calospora MUT 4182]